MSEIEFCRLFSPILVGSLEIKNRVIMPAIHHMYTPDGYITERFREYYWRRAEGGAGLIIVGGCKFDAYGGAAGMMSLASDAFIPDCKTFTDGMHSRGAKVGVQLYHAGRYSHRSGIGGQEAIAPSAVYSSYTRETPREMTPEDIACVISAWAAASVRAQEAGFDLVEVIGSAGYLIGQFLSPLTNKRTDAYGGSWENRTRFARETIAAVRAAVGSDYPISFRVAGHDLVPGSNTNTEAVEFCRILEAAGVDMINVTGGWHESKVPQLTGDTPEGGFAHFAAAVRDAVHIPVAASNRIRDPIVAERLLALGKADMICVGRALIADPDWVRKAQTGEREMIRPCIACNQGCLAKSFFRQPVECMVNAVAGREFCQAQRLRSDAPMQILVIGAGPAGCEFALRAAQDGHHVRLWEESDVIGGQLGMVAVIPGKAGFGDLLHFYETALRKSSVEVVLNRRATAADVAASGADLIVTATGITPKHLPKQLAVDGESGVSLRSAYDILRGRAIAGTEVVIVGGGAVGCETARYLAREAAFSPEQVYFMLQYQVEPAEQIGLRMDVSRRRIAVVDMERSGSGFEPGTGWPVLADLKRLGVRMFSDAKITAVADGNVYIQTGDRQNDGSEIALPCDTLVTAVGASENDGLYRTLKEMGLNVYSIGDSNRVGKVMDAIHGAYGLYAEIATAPL